MDEQVPAPQDAANDALAQAERELTACRQQRRFADAALRAISDAVVIVDLRGIVTLVNPVAAHLTGWPEGESIDRPLGDVVRIVDEQGNKWLIDFSSGAAGQPVAADQPFPVVISAHYGFDGSPGTAPRHHGARHPR